MHDYQWWLASAAVAVSITCLHRDDRRFIVWIGMGAASFVASTWIWRTFGTADVWPAFFAGVTDAMCAAVIIASRKKRFETVVAWLFLVMLCLNFAYLWRLIGPHSAYVFALEIVNWLILATIGTKGALRWVGYGLSSWWHPVGFVDGAVRALDQKRASPGFIYRAR